MVQFLESLLFVKTFLSLCQVGQNLFVSDVMPMVTNIKLLISISFAVCLSPSLPYTRTLASAGKGCAGLCGGDCEGERAATLGRPAAASARASETSSSSASPIAAVACRYACKNTHVNR